MRGQREHRGEAAERKQRVADFAYHVGKVLNASCTVHTAELNRAEHSRDEPGSYRRALPTVSTNVTLAADGALAWRRLPWRHRRLNQFGFSVIHIMRGPLGLEAGDFNLALGAGILDDMSLRVTHLLQEAQLLAGARQEQHKIIAHQANQTAALPCTASVHQP